MHYHPSYYKRIHRVLIGSSDVIQKSPADSHDTRHPHHSMTETNIYPSTKFHRNFTEPSKNPANPPPTVSAPRVAPGETRAPEPTILSHLFPDFLPPSRTSTPVHPTATPSNSAISHATPAHTMTHNYTCHHGPVCRHPPPRSPAAPLDREKPQPPRRPRTSRESHGKKPAVFPHHHHVDAFASRTCPSRHESSSFAGSLPALCVWRTRACNLRGATRVRWAAFAGAEGSPRANPPRTRSPTCQRVPRRAGGQTKETRVVVSTSTPISGAGQSRRGTHPPTSSPPCFSNPHQKY